MGRELVRILNISSADFVVEDLGLHVPRGGSSRPAYADSVRRSKSLRDLAGMYKIVPIMEASVPVWPFIKEQPRPQPEPSPPAASFSPEAAAEALASIKEIERSLRDTLEELRSRPSAPPADVLAAHVHAISQRGGIPLNLPGGEDPSSTPMFLPSKIVPDAKADIRSKDENVDKADLDDGIASLRKLRKKK